MTFAAAIIYWIIVAIWAVVLCSVCIFYVRNPKIFGTARLLLVFIGIDTFRNIFENVYFGLYFGGQYGLFPDFFVSLLGQPALLLIPKLMNVLAGCVVLGLLLHQWLPLAVREHSRSEQRASDLEALAAIDPLTGLNNRRTFEAVAKAELARSQRYMRPMSLLLIDIDHFKVVNDTYGHQTGDTVLQTVATTIATAKREADIVARIGGEEFALLLPETTSQAAAVFAQRVCELVRAFSPSVAGQRLNLTVSIGVASPTHQTTGVATLMSQADEALYEAKRSGRDRVVVSAPVSEKFAIAAE